MVSRLLSRLSLRRDSTNKENGLISTLAVPLLASPIAIDPHEGWRSMAARVGYQDAGIIARNNMNELLFLLVQKDGSTLSQLPIGKPTHDDEGSTSKTAIRVFFEKTGVLLKETDLESAMYVTDTITGQPSVYFMTRELDEVMFSDPKHTRFSWAQLQRQDTTRWYTYGRYGEPYPVHIYDTSLFEQHYKSIKQFYIDMVLS